MNTIAIYFCVGDTKQPNCKVENEEADKGCQTGSRNYKW